VASQKIKKSSTKISLVSIIRLAIFAIALYFAINYLSQAPNSNVLSATSPDIAQSSQLSNLDLRQYLPDYLNQRIDELPNSSAIIYLQQQYQELLKQTNNFPQKQINDLKIQIINQLYQNAIQDLQNNGQQQ